jgi:hypothetical protein
MTLGRKLSWDPVKEQFVGDAEANAMRSRTPRSSAYDLTRVMKSAGLALPGLNPAAGTGCDSACGT